MESYHAILIHPQLSGGRCSGQLHLDFSGISFKSEELNYNLSYIQLSINVGGAGNRFIFFTDKTKPEISIYTSEKSVLKNTHISTNPNFSKELKQSKKTLNKLLVGSLVVITALTLFIAGLYLAKDKMVKGLANQVPVEWEQKAGDKLFSTMSLQYHFIKNDSLKNEFLNVAKPLFKQVENEGYKIELYFVKDPTINAFALPGGKVIVQTGLIENAKSWEEVMGVLGHELAHVSQRHHIRGVINNIGIFAILSATVGDVSAIAGTFANFGGDLASLANSRTFETEADETGWDYLVKAKINPNGLISFFETIKKEQTNAIDSTINKSIDLSFLSTHPDTQNRIDHLKQKSKELKLTFEPLPSNFESFREALLKLK